jgi:hypothetical protein
VRRGADNPHRICCSPKILHREFEHHTKANLLLLISYSLCELHHFAAQPTVFAAKQRNLKPSFFHAAAAASACARLIAVHLCQRRQRFTPNAPSQWSAHAAFLRKGRHPSLLSHLDDVVLPPPATRLMYPFAVSSTVAPPLSL